MTQTETDAPENEKTLGRIQKIRLWIAGPPNLTRGQLLLATLFGWVFVGCSIYAAVTAIQLDNRVTQERVEDSIQQQILTCVTSNDRRVEAKLVAEADVAEDRRLWESIDSMFPEGIPQPARKIIFDGLMARQERIETTYDPVDCKAIGQN